MKKCLAIMEDGTKKKNKYKSLGMLKKESLLELVEMKVITPDKIKGVMVDYLTRKVVKGQGSTSNLFPASL